VGLTLWSPAQFISNLRQSIITALAANPPDKQINNFSPGTFAGAITEAVGKQNTFLQSQAQQVLLVTRASTCALPDLVTFVQDYFLSPPWLGPTTCNGVAVFARRQASADPKVLLVGTIIQNPVPSPSAAIQYQVDTDATNPAYSANAGGSGIGGYALAPGLKQFAQAPKIRASTAGTASTVIAGSLTVIASANVPFDTVTNPFDITNGTDGETAPQLLQRFSDFISTRSGTRYRVAAQIAGVQAGLSFTMNEYVNTDGTQRDGFTTVVVDDGSGAPPLSLLNAVTAAATDPAQGKSLGAQVVAIAPSIVAVSIAVTGTAVKSGFVAADVRTAIQAALVAKVNSNGVGGAPAGTGSGTGSGKVAYIDIANLVASFIGSNVGQGLSSYADITVNGTHSDVALTTFQLARTSNASVAVS
jgi:hypothetical protein